LDPLHAAGADRYLGGAEDLLARGAAFERLAGGFQFVEGPAWHPGRRILVFSDIRGDAMYSWDESSGVRCIRQPSRMANGNTFDREGRLLSCEHASSRVCRAALEGGYEVLASHYDGRELNSPNDIVVKRDGSIYFTDPTPGRTAQFGIERPQELDFQGVFRLDPKSGALEAVADDFSKPNGLCFSLDESLLYVNDTDRQHIRVFTVGRDGRLSGGDIWAGTGGSEPGVADGMKLDCLGNVYCCGSGGIHVFDPDGTRLAVIRTPEVAANLAWGGDSMTELFVTARTSLYRIRTRNPGHVPFVPRNTP
jgi:gluconolactonase